ncbi:MAG TPA: hypothetical protein DCS43_16055 [Verrucomicrobia bacterium]|nr:hypothetical protein [Verrucomicrobiota bacterium]
MTCGRTIVVHLGTLKRHVLVAGVALGALASCMGCSRVGTLDGKERNNQIVAKAYEMTDQGDYTKASALFKEALDAYPTMARPHLDLALLLHDRQKDFLRAIYHYQRYLELRPDAEKKEMIQGRILQAERAFVAQRVTVNQADGISATELFDENQRLQQELEQLNRTLVSQTEELNSLRNAERQRVRAEVISGAANSANPVASLPPVQNAEPVIIEVVRPSLTDDEDDVRGSPTIAPKPVASTTTMAPPSVPVSAPTATFTPRPDPIPLRPTAEEIEATLPAIAMENPVSASRRTYTVQRADSLSKIAFKVYGDATLWRKIQEANWQVMGDSVNVRVGQVLEIPE